MSGATPTPPPNANPAGPGQNQNGAQAEAGNLNAVQDDAAHAAAQIGVRAAAQVAAMAAHQEQLAAQQHRQFNLGFPPPQQLGHQSRTPAQSVPPNIGHGHGHFQQQMQFGAGQFGAQPGQQFQQPMGMPGFFPANPFAQQQMFAPNPFQSTMAQLYQNAMAQQQMAQQIWGQQMAPMLQQQAAPPVPAPQQPRSRNSTTSGHSSGSSATTERNPPPPPPAPARRSPALSDVSNPDNDPQIEDAPATAEPLAQIKSAVAKMEAPADKEKKKLKKVPVPEESSMEWKPKSTNKIIFRDLISVASAVNTFRSNHVEENPSVDCVKDFNRIGEKVQLFFDHINIAETHDEFDWELVGKAAAPDFTANAELQKRVNKALTTLKQERKEKENKEKDRRFRGRNGGNGAASSSGSGPRKSARHHPYSEDSKSTGAAREVTCYNCQRKGHYSRDCKAPKKEK